MKLRIFSKLLIFVIILQFMQPAKADEGMWLPLLLEKNYAAMKALGLKMTPEQIYNINKSSLKDAIINFGNFCSGSIISKDGLIITNHHCGYDAIRTNSTVEKNYLHDGFWAKQRSEELSNQGLTVTFLVRIEDVTKKMLGENNENFKYAPEDSFFIQRRNELIAEAQKGNHYKAEVKDMFSNNQYYLFVYEVFKDVRLVGAPPESIGKFGGDTDNWMWPRHTGDFSLFRVYTGPDGKPATYSPKNIPLKPKHFLPVSLKGIEANDYAMILGYPGRTQRYKTASGIKMLLEQSNPTRIKIRGKILRIMKYDMDSDKEVKLDYASHYASVSNYHKNFIGQNKGLIRMNTIENKLKSEAEFQKWVDSDKKRKKLYGTVLKDIEDSQNKLKGYFLAKDYVGELVFSAGGILQLPYLIWDLYKMLEKESYSLDSLQIFAIAAKKKIDKHFAEYSASTDKKIFTEVMKMYYEDTPKEMHPKIFNTIVEKYNNDFHKFADVVFDSSILASKERLEQFMMMPSLPTLKKDIGFIAMESILNSYYEEIIPKSQDDLKKLSMATRLYTNGMMEMNKEKNLYSDANFTMRLTYGKVIDYDPMDAVHYDHYTTLGGMVNKYDPWDEEFELPKKIMDLHKSKDYGQYAGKNGKVTVCFITDNDITGGNSGSSVINGNGELIGLAFDNNWEGMTGDLVYDGKMKRCINVDIRFVLFVVDKYAGATNLIEEMTLVK